jgi:ABC-type Fe3+-hydroxamate transport system substrate-binding protein
MKTYKIMFSAFLFSILVLFSGCVSTPREQLYKEWISQFPEGFDAQVKVAHAVAEAYHYITDTSINKLQTDEGALPAGVLVTAARDKYRQWQSYGYYVVPRGPFYQNGVKYGDGMEYAQGNKGVNGNFGVFRHWEASEEYEPYDEGAILSSRGRPIFAGRYGDERIWNLKPPFDEILKGDRIADIPDLIGKIKR